MKKYLSMICCLAVLFSAGCGDDKTEDNGPTGEAKLTSFSFKAENNPDYLLKDYDGTISGTAISVKVPSGTDVKALVATFEIAEADTKVTVNGVAQVSGTTANDFSVPVDYLATFGKKNALYTVTVSELPEAVWTKVTEWEQAVNEFKLEIDPTDNYPALAVNADGATSADDVMIYAKLNKDKIHPDTVAARRTSLPAFGFNASGQPYVFYYDPVSGVAKGFIATHAGATWTEECTDIDRPTTVGPTIGSLGNKMFVFTMNRASGILTERFVNITGYNGNSWTKNQTISGRTLGRAYSVIARTIEDVMYVSVHNPAETASNTPHSLSIYKYDGSSWATIVEGYVKMNDTGDSYTPIDLIDHDLAVDKDGGIYIGVAYNQVPQVIKMDPSSKTFNLVASVFPTVGRANYCRIAVSPLGMLYASYKDENKHLFVVSLNKVTKEWEAPVQLGTEEVDNFEFKFAENGTAYLAYNVNAVKVDGVVTSPAKICLYKLATAE